MGVDPEGTAPPPVTRYVMIPDWLGDVASPSAERVYRVAAKHGVFNREAGRYERIRCSLAALSKESHLGLRTVSRALDELEEVGALKRVPRYGADGTRLPNWYLLQFGTPPHVLSGDDRTENGDDEDDSGVTNGQGAGETTQPPLGKDATPPAKSAPPPLPNLTPPPAKSDGDPLPVSESVPVRIPPSGTEMAKEPYPQGQGIENQDQNHKPTTPATSIAPPPAKSAPPPLPNLTPPPAAHPEEAAEPSISGQSDPRPVARHRADDSPLVRLVGVHKTIFDSLVGDHPDVTTEEVAAIHSVVRSWPNVQDVQRVIVSRARHGELPRLLEEVRAAARQHRAEEFQARRQALPGCPHGVAGGDIPRPDIGTPSCPMCRHGVPEPEPDDDPITDDLARVLTAYAQGDATRLTANRELAATVGQQARDLLTRDPDAIEWLPDFAGQAGRAGRDLLQHAQYLRAQENPS